jgi:hypothetical protein
LREEYIKYEKYYCKVNGIKYLSKEEFENFDKQNFTGEVLVEIPKSETGFPSLFSLGFINLSRA